MRSTRHIHIIGCHAEGEVGDVVVGGVAPPPGDTLWDQRAWIAEDDGLRRFLLNEPRGGVFRHINLLVPPKNPRADAAFIIMEPEDTPPMSGSNSICVATVLIDAGIVPAEGPEARLTLEAPGGLIEARVRIADGKAQSVTIRNLPSFADRLGAPLEVEGVGTLTVDTAYGGDSFVIADAAALGFALDPSEAREIAELGVRITAAANEQLPFHHPEQADWDHYSFCQFAGPLSEDGGALTGRNAVVIRPGKIDRSPCGTGTSARMAQLAARGDLAVGDEFVHESIIGSQFHGRVEDSAQVGDTQAIVPSIRGWARVHGFNTIFIDDRDPYAHGFQVV